MKRVLTKVVSWAHELLAEVIVPGSLVVDLTTGTGQDTLFLYRMVGDSGQVVGFDIQSQALIATQKRLVSAGGTVRLKVSDVEPLLGEPGIDLVLRDHAEIANIIKTAPQAIIANLGYLPEGNKGIITKPESTVLALERSCSLLVPRGRLAVVVYPGHIGGMEEGRAATEFFKALNDKKFNVMQFQVINRQQAPFLFVAEKR